MHSLRIITFDSPGLLNDATIYKNIFKQHSFTTNIFKLQYGKKQSEIQPHADVNLFLETIGNSNSNIKDIFPSKYNLFMPNHEFFHSYEELKYVDYILCKTKIAMEIFTQLKRGSSEYNYQCVYTKFTTFIPRELRITGRIVEKNPNLFVHLAGKSSFKNTDILIYTWVKNNGFVNIDPEIKLVITCYKACYNRILRVLKSYYDYELKMEQVEKRNDMLILGNMVLYIEPAPDNEYIQLLKTANVAIAISKMEGFGHYINEARYFGTYVVTINYPPMNELVMNDINGILINDFTKSLVRNIPPEEIEVKIPRYPIYATYPEIDDLANKIIYCIKNKYALQKNSWKGRKMFFSDMLFFENTMKNFIESLILPNLSTH
ncbi:glycosyl transferase [Tupanvirus deep ocean]|uniref:Glycosyl transferase n=2 Tax=Tupanvirus TaxID=2094720 RepID=A0AC62A9P8_9VIRU|nr:glycosyl transferase [Tupanvirus deep ocean]QKU34507.1 glycosyl transferase [Tupanvirus deep ocean]